MKKGLVSIVIPTYNRAAFLEQCLQDIVDQTYQNLEIIIVDDCSTDETYSVVESFKQDYPDFLVKYLALSKNSGTVCIPRNIGIQYAKGEFIAPFDDDCRHLPEKLEVLVKALNDNPNAVLAYGDRITRRGDRIELNQTPDWNPTLENGWGVDNCQFIYRADVYGKIPLIFAKRACDWELARRLYPLGGFVYVPATVGEYVWHDSNRSLDDSTKQKEIPLHDFMGYLSGCRYDLV